MRTYFFVFVSVLCLFPVGLQAQTIPADRFLWLCGLWQYENPNARNREYFYEEWDVINDSLLMGKAYSVYAKYDGYVPDTTILENMILSIESGSVYFTVTVYGENNDEPISYTMSTDAGNSFTFENPTHDYPQKVTYQPNDAENMTAILSGGGETVEIKFKKLESYYSGLKKYFFVMLTKGANRSQSAEEAEQLQLQHLEHIQKLTDLGKIKIAGPFIGDNEWRGVLIFDSLSEQEVEELVTQDPAVKAGRMTYTILPWATQKGSVLD